MLVFYPCQHSYGRPYWELCGISMPGGGEALRTLLLAHNRQLIQNRQAVRDGQSEISYKSASSYADLGSTDFNQ